MASYALERKEGRRGFPGILGRDRSRLGAGFWGPSGHLIPQDFGRTTDRSEGNENIPTCCNEALQNLAAQIERGKVTMVGSKPAGGPDLMLFARFPSRTADTRNEQPTHNISCEDAQEGGGGGSRTQRCAANPRP